MIEVKNIKKGFGDRVVIHDVSAVMEPGKCNLIIGASGSGKTVMMKCLVGLFQPDKGQIIYDGQDFTAMNNVEKKEIRKQIGMLFQGSALFDSLDVEKNVMFPLNMFTKDTHRQKLKRVNEVLERVQLEGVNKKFPAELSGGMKKRVGIARAIVLNPRYLFCDEPNSGLDPQTSIIIDKLIQEITYEYNITTVVNTHDMNSVMEIGDKIFYMYQGNKEWEGTNKELIFSKNQRLNEFIFASAFLQDAKDMRMLEETGKIPEERNMDEITQDDAPPLIEDDDSTPKP
ncbi:MAG TPA: ATP-binding cassette domain-containing protein [Chitinophagaceae bacterium]|nr:ATP-binding cassette domain-containing protein [Chitinophagaceae bacterium]